MHDYGTQRIGQVSRSEMAKVPIPKDLFDEIVKYDKDGNATVTVSYSDEKIIVGKSVSGLKTTKSETEVFIEIPLHDYYSKNMKLRTYNVVKTDDHIELRFYTDKCVFCGETAAIAGDGVAYYDRCICEKCYKMIGESEPINFAEKHECIFCGKEENKCVPFGKAFVCETCHDEIQKTPLD